MAGLDDLWTDGTTWYRWSSKAPVAAGPDPVRLVSLTGAVRDVPRRALTTAEIPEAERVDALRAALGVRPGAVVGALIAGVVRGLGLDPSMDVAAVRRALLPVAGMLDGDEGEAVRVGLHRAAAEATGPHAALVREVLAALPDGLRRSASPPAVEVVTPDGPHADAARRAGELLARFADPNPASAAALAEALLRPGPEDHALCFAPAARADVAAACDSLWPARPAPVPRSGQTRLRVVAATVAELRAGTADFPGGYARIADLLAPGPLWFSWRWTAPGQGAGMLYDGLVQLPDGWVWYPKPWRMLNQLRPEPRR